MDKYSALMDKLQWVLGFFFGVYRNKQTYLNLAYSFLLFPIGIISYIYVIAIISFSSATLVLGIGILSLWFFLYSLPYIIVILSKLSNIFTLRIIEIDQILRLPDETDFQSKIKHYVRQVNLWATIYRMLLFPVTLTFFVITVMFIYIGGILRLDPLARLLGITLNNDITLSNTSFPDWIISHQLFVLSLIGYLLMTIQLNMVNGLVYANQRVLNLIIKRYSLNSQ